MGGIRFWFSLQLSSVFRDYRIVAFMSIPLFMANTDAKRRARKRYNDSLKGRVNRRSPDGRYRTSLKEFVLTLCGDGVMKCCWPGCDVTDPDMLSIDHVNNDGAEEPTGNWLYRKIKREGNGAGKYQTLCHNHQWKKELMRRRDQVAKIVAALIPSIAIPATVAA